MMKKTLFKILLFIFVLLVFSVISRKILFTKNFSETKLAENELLASNTTLVDVTNLNSDIIVEHEHIYKTMYDSESHWEECTICGENKNKTIHSFKRTWALGSESCHYTNSYTDTCSCGYYNTGHKPCVWDGKSYGTHQDIRSHFRKCSICNSEISYSAYLYSYGNGKLYDSTFENFFEFHSREACHTSDGKRISCQDINKTCSVCKKAYTIKQHRVGDISQNNKLVCRVCGVQFGTYSEPRIVKNSDSPSSCSVEIDFKLTNGASFYKTYQMQDVSSYFKTNVQESKNLNTTNTEFTIVSNVKFNSNIKSTYNYPMLLYVKINNIQVSVSTKSIYLSPDYLKPTIDTINVENSINEWCKSKPIVISGTENWTNTVKVEILDDAQHTVFSGKTIVNNGNYSISCIPSTDAGLDGKKFKVIVTDECNNTTDREFEISKIDSISPVPLSENKCDENWTKSKDFTFKATDTGIGDVSIAFNDIADLQLATKNGNEYLRNYKFTGDVYEPKELSVLYKDALGNSTIQKFTINKLDNTSPTITDVTIHNNILNVNSNDVKADFGEGSGVVKYRYVASGEKLDNPDVSSGIEVSATDNLVVNDVYNIKYVYIVAEDLVGNISEIYEFEVPSLLLTSTVNLSSSSGAIELDWSSYDFADKYFVIYRKQNEASEWENIVGLKDKFTGGKYVDILANDKISPTINSLNIQANQLISDIRVDISSNDDGSSYLYYIEAYDCNNVNTLLAISNVSM